MKTTGTVLLLTFLTTLNAWSGRENIRGFELKKCFGSRCIVLYAENALRSDWDEIYVFSRFQLNETDLAISKANPSPIRRTLFLGTDGYYDPRNLRLILRDQASGREAGFNLKNGEWIPPLPTKPDPSK
jgi:hypothetical protein